MHEITVDHAGVVLTEPCLHDAALTGLRITGNDCLLEFQSANGGAYEVVLCEVFRLLVDSFWEGNIVFELRVTPIAAIDLATLRSVCHLNDDGTQDNWLRELQEKNLVLFDLVPTYGADVSALCKEVKWAQRETAL